MIREGVPQVFINVRIAVEEPCLLLVGVAVHPRLNGNVTVFSLPRVRLAGQPNAQGVSFSYGLPLRVPAPNRDMEIVNGRSRIVERVT